MSAPTSFYTASRPTEAAGAGRATDPDGDALAITWWQYAAADSYGGEIAIAAANQTDATAQVPQDAAGGQTIHIVCEGTDSGTPPLTRYQRVVLTVGE